MKAKIFTLAITAFLFANQIQAQDVTTVNAKSSDISDNLDLRAVASIFGESANLEDFERRLNDPKEQISNLDLNNDGQVDYLRVIESVEGNTHLIIIQSVLEKDVFQDVATVEVEKQRNNKVQIQVVGDVYMYGQNYIYEPVYVQTPVIYNTFWIGTYRPYYSPWYWNYYPTYYSYWSPYPVYRYRRNVHNYINVSNHYNYVNIRRSQRAVALYSTRRANGYERMNPNRSFAQRNNVTNRYELDKTRRAANSGGRATNNPVRNVTKANETRNNAVSPRTNTENGSTRNPSTSTRSDNQAVTPRPVRTESTPTRSDNQTVTPRPVRTESTSTRSDNQTVAPRPVRTESTPTRSDNQTVTPRPVRTESAPVRTSSPVQSSAPRPQRTESAPSPTRSSQESRPNNAGEGRRR